MTGTGEQPDSPGSKRREISISRVIVEFPEAVAIVFKRLMRAPRRSRQEMRRRVSSYIVGIEARAREVDYIDVELAQSIANGCHRLIDTLDADSTEEHRCLVQAAVLYFVTDEDAEGDTTSLIGFDDDRLVVDVVGQELGQCGLAISDSQVP
ncbi:MAG: hypothetical protein AMJ59_04795 [Gammaproteobacteria bacterium SG8_31]|jgi:hypothetical protein|nr:MAG: hypothetical protein AMJ59_04795 [Gammaproteobacteria bacterium SG8_31]